MDLAVEYDLDEDDEEWLEQYNVEVPPACLQYNICNCVIFVCIKLVLEAVHVPLRKLLLFLWFFFADRCRAVSLASSTLLLPPSRPSAPRAAKGGAHWARSGWST